MALACASSLVCAASTALRTTSSSELNVPTTASMSVRAASTCATCHAVDACSPANTDEVLRRHFDTSPPTVAPGAARAAPHGTTGAAFPAGSTDMARAATSTPSTPGRSAQPPRTPSTPGRPVLPTHLARDHMARARASHEASAHAKRWPPERFPGAGQLRRYDPALACSRTSKERLLLRLPHWPAVIRLLFSGPVRGISLGTGPVLDLPPPRTGQCGVRPVRADTCTQARPVTAYSIASGLVALAQSDGDPLEGDP